MKKVRKKGPKKDDMMNLCSRFTIVYFKYNPWERLQS
jgi:hypothetical protein